MKKEELTKREVLIMKCVWNSERELSLQQVQRQLLEQFDWDAKRSTIRTFLTDMEKKGYVEVERRGRHSYIIVLVEQDVYRKEQLNKMIDFWFNGSKEDLIKILMKPVSKDK